MKKHLIPVLSIVCCAFVLGFLLGRSQDRHPVQINVIPADARHDLPPETNPPPSSADYEITFPIDLNTADIRQLSALPGIGEGLARRILDYRACYGPFSRPEELLNIDGIGQATLEAVLDFVITGG